MPYARLENFQMYYEEYGRGEPVIFLHGFTLDRRMWTPQINFFNHFYRVILPDARGHGLSEAPESGYSRADRVEDLFQFADNMKIDRFHAVGLSMGGSTALGFALKYPEYLKSLTLVSSGAAGYDIGKKISRIDELARTRGIEVAREKWKDISLNWFGEGEKTIRDLMETMINEHSGAVWKDPRRGHYPREYDLDKIHRIKIPTEIICGSRDKIFTGLGKILNEKIKGSHLKIFENVGHMVNLETPNVFNEELKLFLEGVAG